MGSRVRFDAISLRAWAWVALWTLAVWQFSSDAFSATTTSRILEPLLGWLFPDLGREGFRFAHFLVRKSAHVFIYAVLGALALRALRLSLQARPWVHVLLAALLVVGTASTDEVRQKHSALRRGSAADVGIDAGGGALGIALWLAWRRWRPPPLPSSLEEASGPA